MRTIEYLRRKNLGGYEHEELKISDVVGEKEDVDVKVNELKHLVLKHLGLVEEAFKTADIQLELPVLPKEEKKAKAVKKTKKEEPKEEVVEEKVEEEKKVEEVKEEERPVVKETKAVKKISKSVNYDRTLQTHKNLLGQFLDEKSPRWKVGDNLKKASEASQKLNGTAFLDENGDMLETFKQSFLDLMV